MIAKTISESSKSVARRIISDPSTGSRRFFINTKLKLSIPGIENLKKTYENDNEISVETDKIISKINNLVNNIP